MQKSVLFLCALVVLGLVGRSEGQPGSKIAFISGRGTDNEGTDQNIWLMEADGSNPAQLIAEGVQLASSETDNIGFAWSPDGTKIVFESSRDIWIMEADGTNWVNLTPDVGLDGSPDFSPDGTKIVYTEVSANFTGPYIRTMDANGENKVSIMQRIGQGFVIDIPLDWSPVLGLTTAIEATSWGQVKKDAVLD